MQRHLRICAVENGCAFERRANPRIDFYFLIHLTVTNSYLPDAGSTRRDWPVGFRHFGLISESKPRNICITDNVVAGEVEFAIEALGKMPDLSAY
jgi:hypothetical protein